MRILNICAYSWEIGGPPKIIFDHTQVALREGHQVDILSPISPNERPYPVPEGANLILVPRTQPVGRFFREFSVGLYQYLQKNIRQYDVVHCHGLWHFGALAPFMADKSVAKVVTIHGVLDRWAYANNNWKKTLIDRLAQKAYLQRADVIHINNTDEREDLLRYFGNHHPRIVLIPNGVRMSDFATMPPKGQFRQQYNLPTDRKLVLFMSRLNVKKGLGLLLPAFRDYVKTHPDTVLAVAGPDDGYEATTRQFIDEHQLQDSIRLVGMLTGEAKKAALADADVFTLPSFSEGFSIAVLEAMAAGTPALVSDRVGFGEAIRQHEAAGLVELNPDSVRAGLERLLGDDALRARISQHATALLRSQYDMDIVANQMLDAYRQAIQHRKQQTA
ncbi:hypothetical protein GCM10027578_20450 [Spirosoma luteolum]